MRKIWFPLLAIALLFAAATAPAQAPKAPPAQAAAALAVTAGDRILGNADAPITIIEYASLTCPHCRHFAVDVLPKLQQKWIDSGKVRLVLRDFPLDEPALRAAMIARCAPPERFYAFIETFFGSQEQWVMAPDYRAALEKLALLGGMGKQQFTACLADKSLEDQVTGSRLVASQQLGVESTPTFFVNGTKFEGAPTFEAFDELLTRLSEKK
jgi:protein-disulfide isomerase